MRVRQARPAGQGNLQALPRQGRARLCEESTGRREVKQNTVFFLWLASVGGFLFLIFALQKGSLSGAAIGGVIAVTATWLGARQMHGTHHHYHHRHGAQPHGDVAVSRSPRPDAPHLPGSLPDIEVTVKRRYLVREEAEVVFVPAALPPELRALFAGGRQSTPASRPITALPPEVRGQAIPAPAGHQVSAQAMPALTVGTVAKTLLLGPPKQKVSR
jgi:hypothetical protein